MRKRGHHFPSLCFLDVFVSRALIYRQYIHCPLHVLYTVAVNLQIRGPVPVYVRHVVSMGKAVVFGFSTVMVYCVVVVSFGTPKAQAAPTY